MSGEAGDAIHAVCAVMNCIRIPGCGSFRPVSVRDRAMAQRAARFVAEEPLAFDRDPSMGHVTGSGFVVSPCRAYACLVHHPGLRRWLQPGGHCDGLRDAAATAAREVAEETGLAATPCLPGRILDIDIPARGDAPAHRHYDMRYLFEAPMDPGLCVGPEGDRLAWVPIDRLEAWSDVPSLRVLGDKARAASWP